MPSYIYSVSYRKGCYRHIQISQKAKLSALHKAIIDAFGLSDGHMHVFFMNGSAWDNTCGYYCTGFSQSTNPATDEVRLCDFPQDIGFRFIYIYDFGNERRFTVKLLRTVEEDTPTPVLVRSCGEFFIGDRNIKEAHHEFPKQKKAFVPQDKAELVQLYASAAANLYGFVSLATFCKIFGKLSDIHLDLEEAREILSKTSGAEYVLYRDFVVFPAGDETPALLDDLYKEAHGKPRYVPDCSEDFLNYLDIYYTDTPEITEKIKAYFGSFYGGVYREQLTRDFLQMLKLDYPIQEFVDCFGNEKIADEQLLPLVIEAKNASRIWKNKGFTPVEMARLNGAAPKILKKIGRNDLCPCGSGKKYKKCCGR